MDSSSQAGNILRKQFKDLVRNPIHGISVTLVDGSNMLQWNLTIVGPPDTMYEGGIFNATISFPLNYPDSPPTVKFTSEIWLPNRFCREGNVSIPILNPPGIDPNGYEPVSECWSPVYTVETILAGIISIMLSSPIDHVDQNEKFPIDDESPAEVEAAPMHNMLIPRKNSACSRKDDHHFVLIENINKQFNCDGCKQQGSGPRHRCHNCGYELHEECKSPKGTTSHEFFGNLEFQFFEKPQVQDIEIKWCDACGKDILGFNYHSVDNRYDLHPCCSKLPKKLPINGILFELHHEKVSKVSSRCNWCQEKKISSCGSVPGWAYASRCGDYNFHVHCLMEMLHINASIKDGNLGLEKIDLRHLAKSKAKKRKRKTFSSTVKIFLKTVLSILLGDPTTLLATAIVEAIFIG